MGHQQAELTSLPGSNAPNVRRNRGHGGNASARRHTHASMTSTARCRVPLPVPPAEASTSAAPIAGGSPDKARDNRASQPLDSDPPCAAGGWPSLHQTVHVATFGNDREHRRPLTATSWMIDQGERGLHACGRSTIAAAADRRTRHTVTTPAPARTAGPSKTARADVGSAHVAVSQYAGQQAARRQPGRRRDRPACASTRATTGWTTSGDRPAVPHPAQRRDRPGPRPTMRSSSLVMAAASTVVP